MSFNPNIIVFGVGGAGCNAVNNMVEKQLQGVQFVAANTDMQSLIHSNADSKIQLGSTLTQGLGAGGNPEIGREAVRENIVEIKEILKDCNMLFITAGMGGGTGTGAAPLIAKIAKEMGVLTIGVITKPFSFEGRKKMDIALDGIRAMKDQVGTLIIVPNQNLMTLADEKTTNREAFLLADQVLFNGVAGISDIVVRPGHINLDLADLRGVMTEMGRAVLGTGEATGDDRAAVAAERAVQNPLLENTDIAGAKQLLINISGGDDLTLFETEKAIAIISAAAGENCNIHIGSSTDEALSGKIRVSLVATGIKGEATGFINAAFKSSPEDQHAEHLAAIKNTSLNPLRPQDGEGNENNMDEKNDSMGGGMTGGMATGGMTAGAMATGNMATGDATMMNRTASSDRPIFNNPFANVAGQESMARNGNGNGNGMGNGMGSDVGHAGHEMANRGNHTADGNMTDGNGDTVASEMEDFDNFSKTITGKNNIDDDVFSNINQEAEEFNELTSNELEVDGFTAHRNNDEESDDGAGAKKSGIFKKMFSAFFGDQETPHDADNADDRLSANRLLTEQANDGDTMGYPDVVDLRGDNGDSDEQPQKIKRQVRKKHTEEEETVDDLFSMPKVE